MWETGGYFKKRRIVAAVCLSLGLLFPLNARAASKEQNRAADRWVGWSSSHRQDVDEIRRRAFSSLRQGAWQAAEDEFEKVLTILPADAPSLYGSALALFNLQKIGAAEEKLRTVVAALSETKANDSLLADSLVLSAIISAVGKQNEAAIEKLKTAVALVPNHFDANFSLGRAHFGNGDLVSAVKAFQQAAEIQPANVRARFFLATALEQAGDEATALAEYRTLLRAAPDSAEGNLGIGALLIKIEGEKNVEGLTALQKAVTLNGSLYEARVVLGKTFIRLNRPAEAVEHLRKAVDLAPNNPEPRHQLALAYRKLGRTTEAEAEMRAVKKIHETRRGVVNPNN